MDEAMMEEAISQLMDIFLIVEYKNLGSYGTQDFKFDEFMDFAIKTRRLEGYKTDGVERTKIKLLVNTMYPEKMNQFMDFN